MYLAAKAVAAADGIAEPGYRTVFNWQCRRRPDRVHLHLHVLGGRIMDWPPG